MDELHGKVRLRHHIREGRAEQGSRLPFALLRKRHPLRRTPIPRVRPCRPKTRPGGRGFTPSLSDGDKGESSRDSRHAGRRKQAKSTTS
jgi:hypothetical protein